MAEFDRSVFITKFQEEAHELLQRLNEGVIMLEAEPENRELIDRMLRDAHTLKGSSRMVGLIDVSDIAHRLEDIMVLIRDGELAASPALSDPFFEALDAIVYLTDNRGENEGGFLDLEGLHARLFAVVKETLARQEGLLADDSADGPPAGKPSAGGDGGADDGDEAGASGLRGAAGSADASPDAPWDAEASDSAPSCATEAPAAQILQSDSELRPKVQTTIRVRTGQVDKLLNLISEVVIAQIKSEQRIHELRTLLSGVTDAYDVLAASRVALAEDDPDAFGGHGSAGAGSAIELADNSLAECRKMLARFVADYAEDTSRAGLVIDDLQEDGMRMRMLPVDTIFQGFPRAVRDLAKQFNKEIDLEIVGGDTELDRKVLEEVNDPLVHIVRNAVDHGIESPDVREGMGKPRTGKIELSARQEGDTIVIKVTDDGAGIDPDKVRESAVRKGYITAAEAANMSDRKAMYLIFEAGFSTASIITEISGRGVGMDVVREFVVEKLKGSLDVRSEVGKGATFKLTIPLTLAIIRAVMLRVGNQVFALPTAGIEELLNVDPSEIVRVEGRDVVRRQLRTYPLTRLSDLLGVTPMPAAAGGKVSIVTIGHSGNRLGFIVDGFFGEQQIVIKPLGNHLQKVDNIAGVTVLGAGEIVPILNVPDLMTNARNRIRRSLDVLPAPEPRKVTHKVLICEDSFTTRELERSIFEAAGYQVETAADGAAGLRKLKEGLVVDAVVTDVQMPNMTGFQLAKAIKSDDTLTDIPVIIVTSLERDDEKTQGIEAGADAYITKSVFNQDTLLDTVERLIR